MEELGPCNRGGPNDDAALTELFTRLRVVLVDFRQSCRPHQLRLLYYDRKRARKRHLGVPTVADRSPRQSAISKDVLNGISGWIHDYGTRYRSACSRSCRASTPIW